MGKKESVLGFTLIELLLVLAIIAIMATFIMMNIQASLGRGRDARRKSDLKQIQNALELYHQDFGQYPDTGGWVNSTYTGNGQFWITPLTSYYIKTMPVDPINSGCNGPWDYPGKDANYPNCFSYAYFPLNHLCNAKPIDGYLLVTRLEQYPKSDLACQSLYYSDGTPCIISGGSNVWCPANPIGIYTVINP